VADGVVGLMTRKLTEAQAIEVVEAEAICVGVGDHCLPPLCLVMRAAGRNICFSFRDKASFESFLADLLDAKGRLWPEN
jgi:hypothetical protein